METNQWTDELEEIVTGWMYEIISDQLENVEVKNKALRVVDTGTDDGAAYGTFHILVNDGRFVIEVKASGAYTGTRDSWDWSNDSHRTQEVVFDSLQDCEYEINFVKDTEKDIDKVGDDEVNYNHGK